MRPVDVFLRSLPSSSSIYQRISTAYYSAVKVPYCYYYYYYYYYCYYYCYYYY